MEFGKEEYKELQKYSKELDIDFFATPFDINSVKFLSELDMPAYKLASADLKNTILQSEVAKLKKPVFLSTGGGNMDDVKRARDNIVKYNENLSILHCTASYPVEIKDMNLNVIKTYLKEFPENVIGLSDHENGIDAAPVAYMLGARVFEKHFTLDRASKGTDHAFSLEPTGLNKVIRNLKRIKPKSINDVYKQNNGIVHFSEETQEIDSQVKDFLKKNMYNNKRVIINTDKGKMVTGDLFKYLLNNTKKYIANANCLYPVLVIK